MSDVPPRHPGRPGSLPSAGAPLRESDRQRWNAKYERAAGVSFAVHPLAARALALPPPDGPVLDLASGPSGGALLAAESGRRVTAVDISEVALDLLAQEADRRGLRERITLVNADLSSWTPPHDGFALVLCTGFWDRALFGPAVDAVAPGGVLAWEAFTLEALRVRARLPAEWCLGEGEPASLLPAAFTVLDQEDVPDERHGTKRRLLARRTGRPPEGS